MSRLAWVVLAGAVASPAAAQDVPTFGASTEAVYVDVWVGRDGKEVGGLTAADFEVRDRGRVQPVEVLSGPLATGQAASEATPVHAILLLDTSISISGPSLEVLKAAARAFLDGLGPRDRATLLSFSHTVRLAGPLAGEPASARAALDGLTARGATALHDSVFAALELADSRHGRPVVVVFSDGEDAVSWLPAEDVEAVAKESEAGIYVVDTAGTSKAVQIRVTPTDLLQSTPSNQPVSRNTQGQLTSTRFERRDTPAFLRRIAAASGGQVWHGTTQSDGSLAEAFLKVVGEIKNRYLLRFEPQDASEAGWHELEVKVKGQKADVRARRGYLRVRG